MDFSPKVERYSGGDLAWLGSAHGAEDAQTCTLKVSAFKQFGAVIPAGTPLKDAGDGTFEPVTEAGDTLVGFLLTTQNNTGDVQVAPYVWHGRIRADKLPQGAFDVTTLITANPQFTISKEA